jgi:hypothetical protein
MLGIPERKSREISREVLVTPQRPHAVPLSYSKIRQGEDMVPRKNKEREAKYLVW